MRHQIVIMLLGLMTILSLPAFAIAGSRGNDHTTQPYKYNTELEEQISKVENEALDNYEDSNH